jgi:hypothetical protein
MNATTQRLHTVPLSTVTFGPGQCIITMSTGQWDGTLSAAYDAGWILLELDKKERPVRAYQREDAVSEAGR